MLCSLHCPAAWVAEPCRPHQGDSLLSDLQTGIGRSAQNEGGCVYLRPRPRGVSKVSALPSCLLTSILSTVLVTTPSPQPFLQDKGCEESCLQTDTGPVVSFYPAHESSHYTLSSVLNLNVPSVSCFSPTDSKGMILPICIYFVIVK